MLFLSLMLACPKIPPCQTPRPLQMPLKPGVPHTHTEHGIERSDPYYWLRNKEDPAVISYIEAGNSYTEAISKPLEPLHTQLFDEMLSRIQEDDSSVPYQDGDYWYYSRTESGKAYRIYCRKYQSLEAEEEIILDENVCWQRASNISISAPSPSVKTTKLLAYTTDTNGREIYTLLSKTSKQVSF